MKDLAQNIVHFPDGWVDKASRPPFMYVNIAPINVSPLGCGINIRQDIPWDTIINHDIESCGVFQITYKNLILHPLVTYSNPYPTDDVMAFLPYNYWLEGEKNIKSRPKKPKEDLKVHIATSIWNHREREAVKILMGRILRGSHNFGKDELIISAVRCYWAYYCRSIQGCENHPSFSDYASMLNCQEKWKNILPKAASDGLIEMYGTYEGINGLPEGMTQWYPRNGYKW